jgi:hypothetical protein
MLSGLLDSIKSQFGGKSYWIGSMLPLVLFLAANAVVLRRHSTAIATWLPKVDTLDQKTLLYSALTALLLSLAYILSIMNSLMLEALEGKVGPFRWASAPLYTRQWHSLRHIDQKFVRALSRRNEITDAHKAWSRALRRGAHAGQARPPLTRAQALLWRFRAAGWTMALIRFLQSHGWTIAPKLLLRGVGLVSIALRQNKAGNTGPLVRAQADLESAVDYAISRYQFEIRRLLQRRQSDFPGVRPTAMDQPEGPSANSILGPTTMGNIGRAMTTYTLVRYQLDLDILWTRLQNSLQKDAKDYYSVLQDSKAQVDCAVTLFWLSLVFTLIWPPLLLWLYLDSCTVFEFLGIGIVGPLLVGGFYLLACQSYRVFADVMRSSVDLFRFNILQALHLPLPVGSEEEKDLWLKLGIAIGFGDKEDFQYKHSP